MEPNWNWPNLENWPSEAMWSSILNAEQNLNSLNLFTGLWSHSLSAPFPTHPESTLLWEWLFSPGKRNFLLMWFMENLASFLSRPPRLEKDISPNQNPVLFNLQGSNPTTAISCVSLWEWWCSKTTERAVLELFEHSYCTSTLRCFHPKKGKQGLDQF